MGSGLGLAQVSAFVEQSHGEVAIDSTPGLGTIVSLWLPITNVPIAAAAMPAPAAPALPSMRLLMVEDDSLVSSVVTAALEARGHDVVLCTSADQALEAMQKGRRL